MLRSLPLRRTVGWTLALVAPDGQSVLVTQDDFDGDVVHIYTQHDDFTYKFVSPAPELSGWPRVEDQGCRLDTVGEEFQLIGGAKVLSVNPEESK